jgi:hypothetical protein
VQKRAKVRRFPCRHGKEQFYWKAEALAVQHKCVEGISVTSIGHFDAQDVVIGEVTVECRTQAKIGVHLLLDNDPRNAPFSNKERLHVISDWVKVTG